MQYAQLRQNEAAKGGNICNPKKKRKQASFALNQALKQKKKHEINKMAANLSESLVFNKKTHVKICYMISQT